MDPIYLVAGITIVLLGVGGFALNQNRVRAVGLVLVGGGGIVGAVDGPVKGHPTVGGVATVALFGIGIVVLGSGGVIVRQFRALGRRRRARRL